MATERDKEKRRSLRDAPGSNANLPDIPSPDDEDINTFKKRGLDRARSLLPEEGAGATIGNSLTALPGIRGLGNFTAGNRVLRSGLRAAGEVERLAGPRTANALRNTSSELSAGQVSQVASRRPSAKLPASAQEATEGDGLLAGSSLIDSANASEGANKPREQIGPEGVAQPTPEPGLPAGIGVEAQPEQRKGLRRITGKELSEGLASGALGTFSVEGRDPESLRSARDAAGVTDDGQLVFDRRGLARLGNRLSVSGPDRTPMTARDILQGQQAGTISPDEAVLLSNDLANRNTLRGEQIKAVGGVEEERIKASGERQQIAPEDIAAQANDMLGIPADGEGAVTPARAQTVMDSVTRAAQEYPVGIDGSAVAMATAVGQSFPELDTGWFSKGPNVPFDAGPVFDLMKRKALNPKQNEFKVGGKNIALGKIPPGALTTFNNMADSMREGYADSARQRALEAVAAGDEEIEFASEERQALELQMEELKAQRTEQIRKELSTNPATGDAVRRRDRVNPVSGTASAQERKRVIEERNRRIGQVKDMTLDEYVQEFVLGGVGNG